MAFRFDIMEREQAVDVIKQILESYGCSSVTLLLQPNSSPKGFQVQIENKENFLPVIQKIAEQNGLAIKKKGSKIFLYKE